jgi:hypothetical protein
MRESNTLLAGEFDVIKVSIYQYIVRLFYRCFIKAVKVLWGKLAISVISGS